MPKSELTLKVDHGDEVSLPIAAFEHGLTPSEVGALLFMVAAVEVPIALNHPFATTPEFLDALKHLNEKGLVTASVKERKVNISVNLEKLSS
jgi:hypothetical protein